MPNRSTKTRLHRDNADPNRRDALLEDKLREKARTVKALHDSEARYRRLFESAMDGILILPPADHRCRHARNERRRVGGTPEVA